MRASAGVMLGLALTAGMAQAGERVAVNLPRGVGDGENEVLVAIFSRAEFAELGGRLQSSDGLREASRKRRVRSLKVEPDDAGGSDAAATDAVSTDLFQIKDQELAVVCVASTQAGYVSIWTRQAEGDGPQYTGFQKLYPNERAGSPKPGQKVAAEEILCVGQPSSGFGLRAQYSQGKTEQIYVHVTPTADTQMSDDDVLVLGKSAGGSRSSRAGGDYQSGIAVYSVGR